jgi:hypothetical protein
MKRSGTSWFSISFLAAYLATVVAPAADGDEWRIYAEADNGDVYFFDPSRIKKNGDVHTVWTRIRYNTSVMGAQSYQSFLELDCANRTEKTLQRTFFSDRDWEKPAMSTDMNEKPKRPIAEGSAAERLSEALCQR